MSVWEAEDGRHVTQLDPRPSERVLGIVRDQAVLVTVQPDGDNKVDGRMRCVDLKTKEETFARSGTEFCLDRNGMAVACKTKELAIEIYRLPRGELVGKVGSSMPRGTMAAFDVDAARLLYIAGESDELTVYDTDTGSVVSKINTGWLERIELSPNASVLLLHSFNEAKTTAFGVATGLRLWSTDDSQTRYHRFSFAPDSRCVAMTRFEGDTNNPEWTRIVESRTGRVLAELAPADGHYVNAIYSPTEMRILAEEADGTLTMWERRRPEQWWGVACLPEFWLTVVFALLTLWSLVRDFKTLRKASKAAS